MDDSRILTQVSFTAMENGTPDDFALVKANDHDTHNDLSERVKSLLQSSADDDGAYQISRLDHSLQSATRALNGHADDDWVFAALLHDIGDIIAPDNHAAVAASVIEPYVRPEVEWVVRMHGIFQGFYYWHHIGADPNTREKFRTTPYFEHAVAFCHIYDQCSFDPAYPSKDLNSFDELLQRVFARKPFATRTPLGLEAMGITEIERISYEQILAATSPF